MEEKNKKHIANEIKEERKDLKEIKPIPEHEKKLKSPNLEEKINFTTNISVDKKMLLELKRFLVELKFELDFNEFAEKERKDIIENEKRKIR